MATTFTAQATTRTSLARIARVYFGNGQAVRLCLVHSGRSDGPMLPEREATAQGTSSDLPFLRLWHVQVLKDQHCIWRCPLDKLFCRLLGKGAGAVTLLATKPFHDTSDASSVLVLCLAGRMFGLEPAASFRGTMVFDLDILATDKQFSPERVNRYQSVGFIKINAHGENTSRLRHVQGKREVAYQLSISQNDIEAIKLFGLLKGRLEVSRDRVGQVLSPCYRPDGKCSIFAKSGITPTTAYQEKCACSLEEERASSRFLVGFRTLIGSGHSANSRDRHLGIQ